MKKRAIFSLIFAALTFASCKLEKGGTIEVTNGSTTSEASIAVYKGIEPVTASETAAPGNKVTFYIDEDGTYIVNANFYQIPLGFIGHGAKEAVLSGDNKVSVTVKPTD